MTFKYKCKSCMWGGGEFSSAGNAKNDHDTFGMCIEMPCSWYPVCEPVKKEKTIKEPTKTEHEPLWANTYLY